MTFRLMAIFLIANKRCQLYQAPALVQVGQASKLQLKRCS